MEDQNVDKKIKPTYSYLKIHLPGVFGMCTAVAMVLSYTVAKIVMGVLYLQACRQFTFVSSFLVASGAANTALVFILLLWLCLTRCGSGEEKVKEKESGVEKVLLWSAIILLLLYLPLLIAGSVFAVKAYEYPRPMDPGAKGGINTTQLLQSTTEGVAAGEYCPNTLVLYTYSIVIVELALVSLGTVALLVACGIGGFLILLCKK